MVATKLASWVIRTIGIDGDTANPEVKQRATALFLDICMDLELMNASKNAPLLPVCTPNTLCAFIHLVTKTWAGTPYIWSVMISYDGLDHHRVRFELEPGRLFGCVV